MVESSGPAMGQETARGGMQRYHPLDMPAGNRHAGSWGTSSFAAGSAHLAMWAPPGTASTARRAARQPSEVASSWDTSVRSSVSASPVLQHQEKDGVCPLLSQAGSLGCGPMKACMSSAFDGEGWEDACNCCITCQPAAAHAGIGRWWQSGHLLLGPPAGAAPADMPAPAPLRMPPRCRGSAVQAPAKEDLW